jgi:hypothetical protein
MLWAGAALAIAAPQPRDARRRIPTTGYRWWNRLSLQEGL